MTESSGTNAFSWSRNEKTLWIRWKTQGFRVEAPVGVEPTMADLQSAALATWLRSHDRDFTRFRSLLQGHLGGNKTDSKFPANAKNASSSLFVRVYPKREDLIKPTRRFFAMALPDLPFLVSVSRQVNRPSHPASCILLKFPRKHVVDLVKDPAVPSGRQRSNRYHSLTKHPAIPRATRESGRRANCLARDCSDRESRSQMIASSWHGR